jgi:hypothetical protein
MPFESGGEQLVSLSINASDNSGLQTNCIFPRAIFYKLVAGLHVYATDLAEGKAKSLTSFDISNRLEKL